MLTLEGGGLEALQWLPPLKSLQQLHVARNALSTLGHVATLFPLLEVLDVSGNCIIEEEELVGGYNHTRMHWLHCSSPPSYAPCPSLICPLPLPHMPLAPPLPSIVCPLPLPSPICLVQKKLCKLSRLRELFLKDNPLPYTKTVVRKLLPELEVIDGNEGAVDHRPTTPTHRPVNYRQLQQELAHSEELFRQAHDSLSSGSAHTPCTCHAPSPVPATPPPLYLPPPSPHLPHTLPAPYHTPSHTAGSPRSSLS